MSEKRIVNEEDIRTLIKIDPVFQQIYEKYGQPPHWQREAGFVSLSRIILEQQVSLASANAHYQTLQRYIKTFTPIAILGLSDKEMRDC